MAGSIASKAACQAGGFFLQRVRVDFAEVFIGTTFWEEANPVRGGHVKKQKHGCLAPREEAYNQIITMPPSVACITEQGQCLGIG